MKTMNFRSRQSYRFLASITIACLTGLLVASFLSVSVFAEKEQVGLNADASTKINLGKTGVSVNSTTQVNASESNSGEKSKNESYENSQSQTGIQSEANNQEENHEHYRSSYAKMSADSQNSFTIETEKHLYKPGDGVKIKGSIWSGLITELGGANLVEIQVLDNKGNVVNDQKVQVNGEGEYDTEFTLPNNAENGAYTISAKIEVSADLIGSLTLKTQANLQSSAKFVVVNPNAFAVKAEGRDFEVNIESNSEISNLQFDGQAKKISFTASGETGTNGVTDITIPKSLLSGDMNVMIDGKAMAQDDVVETVDTQDETTLEINYHHSTHTIEVVGTNAVPEFPTSVVVLVVAMASIIIIFKNKIS